MVNKNLGNQLTNYSCYWLVDGNSDDWMIGHCLPIGGLLMTVHWMIGDECQELQVTNRGLTNRGLTGLTNYSVVVTKLVQPTIIAS